jgi:hypothetical protein
VLFVGCDRNKKLQQAPEKNNQKHPAPAERKKPPFKCSVPCTKNKKEEAPRLLCIAEPKRKKTITTDRQHVLN